MASSYGAVLQLLAAVVAAALLASSPALARDPSPLQDFCVADKNSNVLVNGFACKDPSQVTADDFFLSGLDVPRSTAGRVGSNVTLVNADMIPGLNSLGLAMARVDYAPGGLNPPHIHPRATEIQTVLQGTLLAGFVTSAPESQFVSRVLRPGDVFVFPQGLVHFQFNIGPGRALAMSGLSSQNPGVITVANALFGSEPPIAADVLAKALQLDQKTVQLIQSRF